MYIIGGYSSQHGYRSDILTLDLETQRVNKIECKGSAPQGRSAHTAVLHNGEIYIYGGWNGGASNPDFYKYNIARDEWTPVTSNGGENPGPRRSHCSCVYNNAMYVWGGFNGSDNCPPNLYKFDFITKRWNVEQFKGIPPSGRSRARCVQWKNKMAIFGGWDRTSHFNDWHEFNFEHREWKKKEVALLQEGIGQHSAVMTMNKVLVFGGFYANQGKSSNALWTYCLGHLGKEHRHQQ